MWGLGDPVASEKHSILATERKIRCKVRILPLFRGKSGYKKRYRKRHDCIIYGICYGCGGRTRTYDLRVMSPTSFQLLYSAIFRHSLECLGIIAHGYCFVNTFLCKLFLNKISIPIFIFSIHSRKDITAGGLPPAADYQLFCSCCLLYWSVYKL